MTLRWIVAALLWAAFAAGAQAQQLTKIRLSLDWLFEGQTSFLHMARYKGYFEKEGLEVQVDVGTGSSGAFQRIISGAYDAGLGDMSSQIEYLARNTGPLQFESVYVQYDQIPAAFFALKKSGIKSVKDFAGRRSSSRRPASAAGSGRCSPRRPASTRTRSAGSPRRPRSAPRCW